MESSSESDLRRKSADLPAGSAALPAPSEGMAATEYGHLQGKVSFADLTPCRGALSLPSMPFNAHQARGKLLACLPAKPAIQRHQGSAPAVQLPVVKPIPTE